MKYGVVLATETGEGMGRAAKCVEGQRRRSKSNASTIENGGVFNQVIVHQAMPGKSTCSISIMLSILFHPKKLNQHGHEEKSFTFSTIGHWLLDDCPVYQIQG
jgi:hypothetical protein